jgi:hypothetical protein
MQAACAHTCELLCPRLGWDVEQVQHQRAPAVAQRRGLLLRAAAALGVEALPDAGRPGGRSHQVAHLAGAGRAAWCALLHGWAAWLAAV